MELVEVAQGSGPIVLGLPHTGTYVPPEIWAQLNETGQRLSDTDWNIHKLYDGLLPDVTTVRALFHRYVVDPNRDPSGASLYPGQSTTGLVPLTDFDGNEIWRIAPTAGAIEHRRETFHGAYHAALSAEIARVQALHGVAILYDCHSIRSRIPFLFEGSLPDFNIGTNDGLTCASQVSAEVERVCRSTADYSTVLNGRFKGGWTTRHYGTPSNGIHAIQMELAQSTYMEEASPWPYSHEKADRLRPILQSILSRLDHLARNGDLS